MDQVRSWITKCLETHPICRSASWGDDSPLPIRVLDLEVGSSNCGLIRLIESGGMKGRYVCLSYRWGDSKFLNTTPENIAYHKQGIPLDALPQTFQDAIMVCRSFGVRDLWIDALCIIQGDAEDWHRESVRMANAFQRAFFTISATWGDSPGCGSFRNFNPELSRAGPVVVRQVAHPDLKVLMGE